MKSAIHSYLCPTLPTQGQGSLNFKTVLTLNSSYSNLVRESEKNGEKWHILLFFVLILKRKTKQKLTKKQNKKTQPQNMPVSSLRILLLLELCDLAILNLI